MAAADGSSSSCCSKGFGVGASHLELLRAAQKDDFYCRVYTQHLQKLLQQLQQLLLPIQVQPQRRHSIGVARSSSIRSSNSRRPSASYPSSGSGSSSGNSNCTNICSSNSNGSSSSITPWRRWVRYARATAASWCLLLQQQQHAARSLVQILYFAASLGGSNQQSLGEEYCELRTVGPPNYGGWRGRLLLLWAAVLRSIPFAATAALIAKICRIFGLYTPAAAAIDDFLAVLRRFHLALFFWDGQFLHFSQRLLQRRLFRLYGGISSRAAASYLRGFAAVLLLQGLLVGHSLLVVLKRQRARRQVDKASSADASDSSTSTEEKTAGPGGSEKPGSSTSSTLVCLFCQSYCCVPTAAACGHIFCWSCISRWCLQQQQEQQQHQQQTPTCPVCRAACPPQHLLPLRHYESSEDLLLQYNLQQQQQEQQQEHQ